MNLPIRHGRSASELRRDCAAAHRLAALAGGDGTICTYLSAAVPGEAGHYLPNEFSRGFDAVRVSILAKVNLRGEVVNGSGRPVKPTGFTIQAAVQETQQVVDGGLELPAPGFGEFNPSLHHVPTGSVERVAEVEIGSITEARAEVCWQTAGHSANSMMAVAESDRARTCCLANRLREPLNEQ